MAEGPEPAAAVPEPHVAGQSYGELSEHQRFDLYLPANGSGPYPLLLYPQPSEGLRPALIETALAAGFAVAVIDYRGPAEALFPAAVQDVFRAAEALRRRAGEFGLSTRPPVVLGHGSGGHLGALLGLASDDPQFRASLQDPASELRPAAVITLYPPVDFGQIDDMLALQHCAPDTIIHDTSDGPESRWLGAPLPEVPDLVREANPATYVSVGDPPFLIQGGSADCTLGAGQGGLLAAALARHGVPVTYDLFPGVGHGGPAFETEANLRKIADFLRRLD